MALMRAARLRWKILTGLGCIAGLMLLTWRAPAQDEPADRNNAAAEDSAAPHEEFDLRDKLEITVVPGLRSTGRAKHFAAVNVKNISEEDIAGPIVLVVEETGLISLKVQEPTGELETGEPYVEVLAEGRTLRAGRSLRTQKIEFTSEDRLSLDQRRQFSLELRALYLPEDERTADNDAESDDDENIPGKSYSEKDFDRVAALQEKMTIPFMQKGNGLVYGTAVAENVEGELVVKVYAQREGVDDLLPDEIKDVDKTVGVEIFVIGEPFSAVPETGHTIYVDGKPYPAGSNFGADEDDGGSGAEPGAQRATERPLPTITDPTLRFPRPVPIGVSISNADRLLDIPPRALCYSGTLGCRCVDALGNQYILTNNHVGATFCVPACANPLLLTGVVGERIVQPSTGDKLPIPCVLDPADVLGVLVDWEDLVTATADACAAGTAPVHYMDAAVIQCDPGTTGFSTPPGGWGAPSRTVKNKPRLSDRVQKYGRTTIQTEGNITGLNVAACVNYGGNRLVLFLKQIECANLTAFAAPLSQGGDSGSLVVIKNPGGADDRQPVGLLFAGGPAGAVDATLANPLPPILARFGLTIDDGTGTFENGVSGTMGGSIGPVDPPSEFK
ncbi:MAG: hypothetical protein DWQ34_01795 [Planctomycetota bacterium]|mgnify:FL=1|nr:MAG: hypothetical protein DWQ34_01795 [Planctomycetota bacterium]REK26929.1 MAG: hypothetical protein DWQ41_08815 [Planctomycetota bacterium]REK35418.1 MAG: hypothetical protein DWQ45_11930 [Planctomycetota bacterium]